MPRKYAKKKSAPRRRGYGRRRGYRRPQSVSEWASCTESVALSNITGLAYNMNQPYALNGTCLAQFINRAVPVAQAYQHYRIKRIMLEFKPQVDTFIPEPGAAGVGSFVPNMFYIINKSGSVPPNATVDNLRAMGAKPIRFDERTIKVAWRPSVLQENAGVLGDVGSSYKISPWCSTNASANQPGAWNPSTVQHLGISWFINRPGVLPGGFAEFTYDIQITVDFQFKKPLVKVLSTSPEALQYAEGSLGATVQAEALARSTTTTHTLPLGA